MKKYLLWLMVLVEGSRAKSGGGRVTNNSAGIMWGDTGNTQET
jgi:hypothetical protein